MQVKMNVDCQLVKMVIFLHCKIKLIANHSKLQYYNSYNRHQKYPTLLQGTKEIFGKCMKMMKCYILAFTTKIIKS